MSTLSFPHLSYSRSTSVCVCVSIGMWRNDVRFSDTKVNSEARRTLWFLTILLYKQKKLLFQNKKKSALHQQIVEKWTEGLKKIVIDSLFFLSKN